MPESIHYVAGWRYRQRYGELENPDLCTVAAAWDDRQSRRFRDTDNSR